MMQLNDLINGAFELLGGFLQWWNVRAILRDREIKGVYWPVAAFFAGWGIWNLYYYPSLHQWMSFFGGLIIVTGNLTWVVLAVYFSKGDKHGVA